MKKQDGKKVPERSDKTRDETLRGDNRRLRKEVARLRKENEKLRGIFNPPDEEENADQATYVGPPDDQPRCPHCKAFVKPFQLRELWYYKCHECNKQGQYK